MDYLHCNATVRRFGDITTQTAHLHKNNVRAAYAPVPPASSISSLKDGCNIYWVASSDRSGTEHRNVTKDRTGPGGEGGHAAIIISHRFSIVRSADWIGILYPETGPNRRKETHDEFIKENGLCPRLFQIQARHHRQRSRVLGFFRRLQHSFLCLFSQAEAQSLQSK